MRVCAIDCGSNSFHLLIADIEKRDQFEIIADDKTLLYLGAEVAKSGGISEASLLRAKRVMRHYKTLISRHNVDVVKCVATSAIRSATNGDHVIESLSKTLSHDVKVISGVLEAEIIFRGISAVSSLPETRVLNIDMGGGSLEIMAGQRHGLEFAASEPLGASRLATELKVSDPLTTEDIKNIEKKCDVHFKEFKNHFKTNDFSNIVVSSGTLNNLVTIARARVDGFLPAINSNISVTAKELIGACDELIKTDKKSRKKILAYDDARSDFIQTAAVIAKKVAKLAHNDSPWYSSPYALREGLVLKIGDEHLSEGHNSQHEISNATISKIEKKILALENAMNDGNNVTSHIFSHSQNVLEISVKIFNALKELHGMNRQELELLKYGARLHDLGETISRSKHDIHGAYILFNTVLPGFSPNEATMLRSIIRCHRSHDPKISDRFVGRLDENDLIKVKWLTAILRIADGIDSGKVNAVEKIKIAINPDVIYIYLHSKTDIELEVYSARRKRLLLEEMSSRDIIISQSDIS